MRTVGVDLATQPQGTAIATVDWADGRATVIGLERLGTDDLILAAIRGADFAGIDAPLGWPESFIDFVNLHRAGNQPGPELDADEWRRSLAYRVTDRMVERTTGRRPLSVSTDRLGLTAMRASTLLAVLRDEGEPIARGGGGRVMEVYPAAALRVWKLPHRSYKTKDVDNLVALVDEFAARTADWLDLGGFDEDCRRSHDAFDALIASLATRSYGIGQWLRPAADEMAAASTEGWIVIPTGPLDDLARS